MATITWQSGNFRRAMAEAIAESKMPKYLPWANRVAKYFKGHIDGTETFLKNQIRDSANFQIQNGNFPKLTARNFKPTHHVFDEAMTDAKRAKLLGQLGAMLHFYAMEYHRTRFQNNPAPANAPRRDPTDVEVTTLITGDTLAAHALRSITHNFQQSLLLACQRIYADWNDIETLFFEGQGNTYGAPHGPIPQAQCFTLLKVSELKLSGGETHKGGRQLIFIKFRAAPDTVAGRQRRCRSCVARGRHNHNTINDNATVFKNLCYKPSDVEFDARIVGNTQMLNHRLAPLVPAGAWNAGGANDDTHLPLFQAGGSLFERLNALGAPNLPTYRTFPRKPGSRRADNAIADSYGYIEFLSHRPKRSGTTVNGEHQGNIPQAEWDWIVTTQAQSRRFYDLWGWYTALALVFAMNDAHEGNFIVHNKEPYFIDLEASIAKASNTIQATLMNGIYNNGTGAGYMSLLACHHGGQNHWTQSAAAAVRTNAAIDAAITFLATNYAAIDQWWQHAEMARTIVRVVPRTTRVYGQMLQFLFECGNCTNTVPAGTPMAGSPPANWYTPVQPPLPPNNPAGLRNPFRMWMFSTVEGDLFHFYNNPNDPDRMGRPLFALLHHEHDYKCLMKGDFPAYYRRLNSRDLLNARGTVVAVADPVYNPVQLTLAWSGTAPNIPLRRVSGPRWFDYDPDPHKPVAAGGGPGMEARTGIELVRFQLARCRARHLVTTGAGGNAPNVVPGSQAVTAANASGQLTAVVNSAKNNYTASWVRVCPVNP
jgi:hypothetical protein